ncbi:MAG: lysylphosphatidylglycerol synthase transmembrane domain-containing protein [Planctomycetota bacterium]|jgi:uncharacterized protein (TIRG00374 family)
MQKKHLINLCKLIFVVGLMWFVLSQISWQDSYQVKVTQDDDGAVALKQVYGRILGPWDAPEVRFVPDESNTEIKLQEGQPPAGSPKFFALLVEGGLLDPLQAETAMAAANPKQQLLDAGVVTEKRWREWLTIETRILPGLPKYWLHLDVPLFLMGAFCYLVAAMFAITRWWWLLKTNDLSVSYWDATRFAWIGIFFNNIVPGQTGGDLIKALYVMKRCHGNRAEALVSVIVDRVMGLGSLSLLAAFAVLFYLDDSDFRLLAVAIWGVLLGVVLLGVIAFSRRIRNLIRLPGLIQKLPGGFGHLLQRLDQAVFFYRSHKAGMFVWMLGGMGSHAINVLCVYFIGEALGMGVALQDYFVLVPVILIVSAIPIAPNGWGVGEYMFGELFRNFAAGAGAAQTMYTRAISLSLLYRIHLMLWSLLGGLILLFTKDRVTRLDVEHEVAMEEAEEMAEAAEIGGDGEAISR